MRFGADYSSTVAKALSASVEPAAGTPARGGDRRPPPGERSDGEPAGERGEIRPDRRRQRIQAHRGAPCREVGAARWTRSSRGVAGDPGGAITAGRGWGGGGSAG